MVVSFLFVNGRAVGAGDGGFLAAPVGLALDDELMGGGDQPVDGGLGEEGVGHHGEPFLGRAVRSDYGGGPPVALDAELVEVGGLGGAERLEGQVVDDEELHPG